jgi:hypothetical protein
MIASLALGFVAALAMLVSGIALRALGRAEEREDELAPDSAFWRPRF